MTDTRITVIALRYPPDGRDDKDSLMNEAAEEIEALRLLVDDLEVENRALREQSDIFSGRILMQEDMLAALSGEVADLQARLADAQWDLTP